MFWATAATVIKRLEMLWYADDGVFFCALVVTVKGGYYTPLVTVVENYGSSFFAASCLFLLRAALGAQQFLTARALDRYFHCGGVRQE